jgi:hypothetical protein
MDEWVPLASYRQGLTQHNEFDIPANRAPGRQYRMKKPEGKANFNIDLNNICITICLFVMF